MASAPPNTIASYPVATGPLDGSEGIAAWQNGQQVQIAAETLAVFRQDVAIAAATEAVTPLVDAAAASAQQAGSAAAAANEAIDSLSADNASAGLNYRPGTSVQAAIDKLIYASAGGFEITGMTINPSQAEIGSTVPLVTLAWSLTRNPTNQAVNGAALTDQVNARGVTYGNVTESTDYALVASDAAAPAGVATDNRTVSIAFFNKGHAGIINKSDASTLTPADVNNMSQLWFADGDISRSLSFVTAADGYLWYSQPASLPDPSAFKVGGFAVTPARAVQTHTTATGEPVSYHHFLLSDLIAAGTNVLLEVIA